MSDNPLAGLQPDANNEPPAGSLEDEHKVSPEEQADQDEWDSAADNLFPELNEEHKDEPAKSDKKPEENEAGKAVPKDKKPDEKSGAGNADAGGKGKGDDEKQDQGTADDGTGQDDEEDEPPEPTDAATRLTAREQQAALEAVKTDVAKELSHEFPTEWRNKEGELIDSIEKVMEHINPATVGDADNPDGRPYTREEAAQVLAQVERQLSKNAAEISRVAEVQLDIKDQSDVVNYQYGELLRAMPELQKKLWNQYQKTLTQMPTADGKGTIIVKAPVSLRDFYETALEPYAQLGRRLEAQESQGQPAAAGKSQNNDKQTQQQQRQQRRADRSDIYGGGKIDTSTEDDKEWDAAALNTFGEGTLRSAGLIK